jgi:hypothetical protein
VLITCLTRKSEFVINAWLASMDLLYVENATVRTTSMMRGPFEIKSEIQAKHGRREQYPANDY